MRNDKESLAEWLKNSNDIKFGNLMWNGEGVDDEHPLRKLREEKNKDKVDALVAYLLEQDCAPQQPSRTQKPFTGHSSPWPPNPSTTSPSNPNRRRFWASSAAQDNIPRASSIGSPP